MCEYLIQYVSVFLNGQLNVVAEAGDDVAVQDRFLPRVVEPGMEQESGDIHVILLLQSC